MADEQTRVKTWARVPDGATLRIAVTGTAGSQSVRATVDALSSDNQKTLRQLNTARGTPFEFEIGKGKQYSVDVLLEFDTAATAILDAEITKRGDRHGKPFHAEVRGASGAKEFFTLNVLAERG